ncbi:ABC transporter ATP-binding protein [Abyssisolibacter fermentans]|uniref:ABC transporter ATP-binding protein n=1 Tax=Abyssisolibacter fermentans TaxID=1766203 RepID=UPI00082D5102|nr:ABC transporter ATP-binding protein [Abyssisolibacter fermentans]
MSNKNMKFFLPFVKPYKKDVLLIFFLEVLTILSSVAIPYILGELIHSLEEGFATFKSLSTDFLSAVLLYFIWDMSNIFIDINFSKINKGIENDIKTFCYKRIFNAKMNILQTKSEGEIITKIIRDTEKLEKAFSEFFYLVISIIHILALFIMMFKINFILTLIIVAFFIVVAIMQKLLSKSLEKLYCKYKISEENLLIDLKNYLAGILSIKVFSLENKCISLLNKRNEMNLKTYVKLNKKSGVFKNLSFFIISVFRVVALFAGGILYIYKKINIGSIFAMYSYSIQLSTQLRNIIEIDIILKDITTSLSRVIDFSNEFQSNDFESNKIEELKEIKFDEVTFKYENKTIISNLNFVAKKNDIIAIRGSNGSGKTTLTNIICGCYKLNNVYINGNKQNIFSEKEILSKVSCVPQNIHLFPVAIIDNISCFGRVSKEKVYEICKELGIHEKIESLHNGYNTLVNEKNLNLSGGEKQIICIARAMLKESDVLILDEINSALDKIMEENIINNLKKYFNNKIVFVISHKENILKLCNYEINLDEYKKNEKDDVFYKV